MQPSSEYNERSNSDISFWSTITLLKSVVWEVHCHDVKSTSPAKDLVFLNSVTVVNILKMEGMLLG
jgi:hypothetical protein